MEANFNAEQFPYPKTFEYIRVQVTNQRKAA